MATKNTKLIKLTIPLDFAEECKSLLFTGKMEGTRTYVLVSTNKPPKPISVVEVNSYHDLLLATITEINSDDLEFYEPYSEDQSRQQLREMATSGTFSVVPVQITPCSYLAFTSLGLVVDRTEIGTKPTKAGVLTAGQKELVKKLVDKYFLEEDAKAKLLDYAKTRNAKDRTEVLTDLLTKKKSIIEQMFIEEGLEELEEELLTSLPWGEAYERFAEIWGNEEDQALRKRVYRDLDYEKDPKKTPQKNKQALAQKFKVLYEALDHPKRREFIEKGEEEGLEASMKILLGKKKAPAKGKGKK